MNSVENRGLIQGVHGRNGRPEPAIEAFLESITDGFVALDRHWTITHVNGEAERLCAMRRDEMVGRNYWELFPGAAGDIVEREFHRAAKDGVAVEFENYCAPWQRWFHVKACPAPGESLSVFFEDISERKHADQERSELLERERAARDEAQTLNEISRALAAERDLEKLVQLITDAATRLTGAQFGSFFYNVTDAGGESYVLYTLSGAPREAFSKFPLPRNTPVFGPTFRGASIVRSDDITKDPRYGKMAPYYGMPKGHLPVRSYLAAPVKARDGEVLGGLFFGHAEPGKFTERVERLIVGLAAHAAVAIENAREFEKRRRMEELLRQSEQRFREIIDALPAAIYTTDAEGRLTHFNEAAIALSGRVPKLGTDEWCVTWKLYNPDGLRLPHDQCPMAIALKEKRSVRGAEAIAERPDGSRLWFTPFPTPLFDAEGALTGGINMLVDITERKKAEEARNLLGAIVDSSDDAIVSKNLEGVITSWNKSAERLFGYTAEEAIGQTVAALLIPADRQEEEPEILSRLRKGERVDHFETLRRRKDGTLLDISLTISPVRDNRGSIIGASKIARNITERKRAERDIESLNEQLRRDLTAMTRVQELSTRLVEAQDVTELLGDILSVALEITTADKGDIQLLDGRTLRISNQRGFEKPFLDFFNEVRGGHAACSAALARSGRIVVENVAESPIFDSAARKAMLDAGALAVQSTPLVTRSGEILGMFSTHYSRAGSIPERDLRWIDLLARQAADLIERRRAEQAVRAGEERLRVAQTAAKIGIFDWDVRTNVNTWSPELEGLYGLQPGCFGGTQEAWEKLVHPEDLEHCRGKVEEAFRTGLPMETEFRVIWPDHSLHWLAGRFQVYRDDDGKPVRMSGVNFEITERKRVESELRRANRDLEQFAYSASHDLQEPLRTLKIYSELLLKSYADATGENAEYLGYLRQAATRMEMLVRDLLDFTKVNRVEISDEETDAGAALSGALANLQGAIAESGAAVTFEALPRVRMAPSLLQQVFQNLISNAIKYRDPQRLATVHIGAQQRNGSWIFSVCDNGIGIESEYKEKIFGLFTRLHGADRYPGTGIGLAICHRIVERYHGRIWVESEPGEGSDFRFSIPV